MKGLHISQGEQAQSRLQGRSRCEVGFVPAAISPCATLPPARAPPSLPVPSEMSDNSQTARTIAAYIKKVSRPTHTLERKDTFELDRACEVAKDVCKVAAERLIAAADADPCLQSCACDGTPISVSVEVSASLPSGRVVRRRGKASHEFLVTSEFVRRAPPVGLPTTVFGTTEPVPLTNGKTADRVFEAARARWRSLRQLGHRAGAVQHYCFDRCGMEAIARRMRQWHELVKAQWEGDDEDAELLHLLEWVEVSACACHDLHNSFKWSLSEDLHDSETMRDCFIGVESLRNSFDVVLVHIHEWVALHLQPSDPWDSEEKQHWHGVWAALVVDEEVASLLRDVELRFEGGRLAVTAEVLSFQDPVGHVVTLLLGAWGIRRFSDSRWLTIGPCARGMIAAALLGLSSFVLWVQTKPTVSGYFLNGFHRLQPPHWLSLTKAALVSKVPDAALRRVMQDSRVALLADELRSDVKEAAANLEDTSNFTWEKLASIAGVTGGTYAMLACRLHTSPAHSSSSALLTSPIAYHGDFAVAMSKST